MKFGNPNWTCWVFSWCSHFANRQLHFDKSIPMRVTCVIIRSYGASVHSLLVKKMRCLALCTLLSAYFATNANAEVIVYSNDFDGTESFQGGTSGGFSGVATIESVQGYAGFGNGGNVFGGQFLRNTSRGNPAAATVLTLNNLPAHTAISLDFLLAIIDSWDGASSALGNQNSVPDNFNVRVDGVTIFSEGFDEVALGDSYNPPPGGLIVFRQQLGFSTGPGIGWFDSGYYMGVESSLQNIPHTASSITIEFFGSGAGFGIGPSTGNDGTDETWAIENITVSVTAVPEPASIALWLSGFVVFGIAVFYRSRRVEGWALPTNHA